MKVKITADSKKVITLATAAAARRMVEDFKEEDIKEYAGIAARIAGASSGAEILKAEAEISGNCRVWNAFTDDSEKLDIWMTVYALDHYKGFFEIGAYISDLWESTGDNAEELRQHMFINHYEKKS